MNWTFALILVPTACYTLASCLYFWRGDIPLGITYSGYAWANVGLLWLDARS
jgi:hypothetical protein